MNALIVEDNQETRLRIVADLEHSGLFSHIYEAVDGLEGFRIVSERAPDLILCDVEMPRMDGLKFLNLLHTKPDTCHIPVLMLTGVVNRSVKLRGLTEGAVDFVQIPYDPQELIARVKLHLATKRREDELKRKNRELELLSNKDPLTGAFNRRYLGQRLNAELMRAARSNGALSVLMLDIDRFKKINDSIGHQAGDQVLQHVTAQIMASLRDYDLLFRYGGEEFVVLLPDTRLPEATIVAQRLCIKMHSIKLSGILEKIAITVSAGVASFPGPDTDTADKLLAGADAALYEAKSCGRDQVAVHGYELTDIPAAKISRRLLRSRSDSAVQPPAHSST
ncbi:MAG: diguanylate cyclase [Trichlorobacter sp.]|jgi:diguanylate cyclase (GGDEF)-like protein